VCQLRSPRASARPRSRACRRPGSIRGCASVERFGLPIAGRSVNVSLRGSRCSAPRQSRSGQPDRCAPPRLQGQAASECRAGWGRRLRRRRAEPRRRPSGHRCPWQGPCCGPAGGREALASKVAVSRSSLALIVASISASVLGTHICDQRNASLTSYVDGCPSSHSTLREARRHPDPLSDRGRAIIRAESNA
jgi:hypothetical protein